MEFKSIAKKVAGKAGNIAKSAAKKTGVAANSAKLTLALKNAEIKLNKKFTVLGKLFYEQTKGTDVRTQIVAQIVEINEQKVVIADLKALIDEINGKATCPSCGKVIDLDAVFCPACGYKQTVNEEPTKEEIIDQIINCKGLDTDGFVEFFKDTTVKYF